MTKFKLNVNSDPQAYGIGLKEVWEVKPEKFKLGSVTHTMGWPIMDNKIWSGSFIYHWENNLVSIGYVVGLDYENPWLSPYQEFQRLKHHPHIANLLEGGRPVAYGARALNEGGFQAIPKLVFPGGALLGCAAGFLNVPKIKGIHNAMKSGILAAESSFDVLNKAEGTQGVVLDYENRVQDSWIWEDLKRVRNIHPAFAKYGNLGGIMYTGMHWLFFKGKEPWTFHHRTPDNKKLKPASQFKKINYPKPDDKLSFSLLTNLALSGTNHNEDQPAHLKLKDPSKAIPINYQLYSGPESRYCPAGVYEYIEDDKGQMKLTINAQNCLHCKTCDIKDVEQNIYYTTPEGGGGPSYAAM